MASSKARNGTNLKEKETSSPSSRLQRTPPSIERRSEKHLPVKQTPNNLKPKSISPAMNTPKSIKTHQSTPSATVKHAAAAQKPKEKPRSPSTGQVRLPYAAPKQFSSLKPSLEKVSKNAGGKPGQLAKSKNPNSRTEAPAPVAPIPNEEEHKVDSCDIVVEQEEPVDSATIEANLDDSPQLINCADKVTDDPMQTKVSTENVVVEPVNELESKSTNEEQEVQVAEPANEKAEAKAKRSVQKVKVAERASEAAKPTVIRVAKDASSRNVTLALAQKVKVAERASEEAKPTVIRAAKNASLRNVTAAKKEATSHNEVIEEAKSKFLEKRKNKVLALVGAFETVMALQEPEGQQGQH